MSAPLGPARPAPLSRPLASACRAVVNEIQISCRFISNDVWTTVLPATAFVLAAGRHSGHSGGRIAVDFLCGALYFWLYIYGFTLTNQLYGVEEDRVNKPFRPLVTGRSSYRGAQRRALVVLLLFPVVAWWFGVLFWALAWEATYLLTNVARWERHWFLKNLSMGIGVTVQLAAAWSIVTPLTPLAWRWVMTLAVSIWLLIPLQDLRDVKGDLVNDRKTFPIALGERFTRVYLATGFALLPVVVHLLLVAPGRSSWGLPLDAVLAAISWLVAVRVVTRRAPEEDHVTYRRFEQWYTLALITAIIVL
ncbi:4-hydroxybenzoate polyprenyltransferase [Streptomyces sp. 840.1]|uniref:UbiA family prenyltransferase n=1 Tax=Streptomyces sp. 840.1 TaxID=2485152 RepID=UPI000FB78686|nr:UbiA family prenyltransferase [Streptomyces sp. 840.1]ROQ68297.1 4-hydroxybenzoate polyprenyltransferase [Streptomyces sp. 840.1]